MNETSSVSLSTLVRDVLPKLQGHLSWKVNVVEGIEDAGAFVEENVAVVRIQKDWLPTIYDKGLSRVTRHYPLALVPVSQKDIPIQLLRKDVDLWYGITIELDYRDGLFTGALNVGHAYVAVTFDQLGLHAHSDPLFAGRKALSERQAKLRAIAARKKTLTRLRAHFVNLALSRLNHRCYDSAFVTSLDPFRGILPTRSIRSLEKYDHHFVPLRELERESAAEIPFMSDHMACSLVYELELAVSAAHQLPAHTCSFLTDEENTALEALLFS